MLASVGVVFVLGIFSFLETFCDAIVVIAAYTGIAFDAVVAVVGAAGAVSSVDATVSRHAVVVMVMVELWPLPVLLLLLL